MATDRSAEYGSDVIVDLMRAFDIEYAAFNPGSTFRSIIDSIVNYGGNHRPEVIQCLHEEISVAIAHGYAKAAGKPMVAITHDLVGLQHASMAIYNAWCDRVPIIVLGGTGPMDITKRKSWIDWVHTGLIQGNLVRDFVKWDDQPHNLASVPESFIRAYRLATTEPKAPVYVCYDAEIQSHRLAGPVAIPPASKYPAASALQADPAALQQAAEMLVAAENPVIIADYVGRNPAGAQSLQELAELLAIPVIDRLGRFNLPTSHPLYLGNLERRPSNTGRTSPTRELLQKADVVLALDVRDLFGALHAVDLLSPQCKVIHISLWDLLVRALSADFERLSALDLNITANTSVALPELVTRCQALLAKKSGLKDKREKRFSTIKALHEGLRERWREEIKGVWGLKPVSPVRLASEVWEVVKGEDWVLTHDILQSPTHRIWDFQKAYQNLGSSSGGGLGYGVGASIGAALAHKKEGKLCIDLQTDGDFLYTPGALWTAAHHKIPLLVVMFNNRSYYNSERHAEETALERSRNVANRGKGTHIDEPPISFARLAEAQGVYAESPLDDPSAIKPALLRALKYVKKEGLPALVDVVTQPR